jgi:predicted Zn-dependent peptidase
MTGETLQEIHRRLGLPEIPQEAIDKAREQIREHEQSMTDPRRKAARRAESTALLAQFRRPKVTILPGESLPEIHRRLGLPEIPQEAIDRARQQIQERARLLADPKVQAEISANRQAIVERLREFARNA